MSKSKKIAIIEDDWKHFQAIKSLLLDIDSSYNIFPLCDEKSDFNKFNARLIRSLDSTKKSFQTDKIAFVKELSDFGKISLYVIDQVLKSDNTTLTGTCFYKQNSITVPSFFLTISTQAAINNEIQEVVSKAGNCGVLRKPEGWEGTNKTVEQIKQVDTNFNEQFKARIKNLLGITKKKEQKNKSKTTTVGQV
jgi:hypothetical protein